MIFPAAPSIPIRGLREQQAAGRGTPTPCGVSCGFGRFSPGAAMRLGAFLGDVAGHAVIERPDLSARNDESNPAYAQRWM